MVPPLRVLGHPHLTSRATTVMCCSRTRVYSISRFATALAEGCCILCQLITLNAPLSHQNPRTKEKTRLGKNTSAWKDVMTRGETNLRSCAIQINAIRLPDETVDTMAAFHAGLHKLAK